jgi:hypothetical protein
VTISRRTVVTCNHADCDNETQTEGQPSPSELSGWLESSGWVQFRAKKSAGDPWILNFCPLHLAALRLFFGPLDSADGLVLSQQGVS